MLPKVYGIPNCDQVRKARAWLGTHGIEYDFHDLRRDGLARDQLERWLTRLPWDALLNKRGTTWRRLGDERRAAVVDQRSAVELMLEEPTLIKRPIVEVDDRLLVGFNESAWRSAFGMPA